MEFKILVIKSQKFPSEISVLSKLMTNLKLDWILPNNKLDIYLKYWLSVCKNLAVAWKKWGR